MAEALKQPIRNVIENKLGSHDTCGHIIAKIEEEGSFYAGFDVKKGNNLMCNIV